MSSLKHYGTPRKSGRYPWGSGDNPYQNNVNFLGMVADLRKEGMTDAMIAKSLGMKSSTQLRAKRSIAINEKRAADVATALKLKDKGYSNVAIGKKMSINESSVRSLLDPAIQARSDITQTTANMLKDRVNDVKYLDIGVGTERHIGISKTRLNTAVAMLREEGYKIHYTDVEQLGAPGNYTSLKVLTPPDVDGKELWANRGDIRSVVDHSYDGGRSYLGLEPVKSVDSSRVKIIYSEEGGSDKDGVLEIRPGVEDLNLGNSRYSQVRVGVDDKYYMKGMAVYSDDLPDGIDILYNSTKTVGTPPEKVFKTMETDPDNPFGSTVRQSHYNDINGKQQVSALNIMGEKEGSGQEGAWDEWSKTLSSQMLSKQSPALAKRQLGMAYDVKQEEYNEIISLTNSAVKRRLLDSFADDCDSSSVHLKAAALPRQRNHVILPLPGMKETEVYAPNYRNGEQIVLVRHPHGGIFEIPQLIVNNKHPAGIKLMGNAKDALGISPQVAELLSGADFDGDTVLAIPNSPSVGIKVSSPLKGLKDFDPQERYPYYEGMTKMKPSSKGRYMGDVSNLITDMSIQGATDSELAAAVRHSMVVIDAEKHDLNYKQSHIDNGIASLKTKYQGGARSGASTLVSQASSDLRVPTRQQIVNPKQMTPKEKALYNEGKKVYRQGVRREFDNVEKMTTKEKAVFKTGKKVYRYVEDTYTDKDGKTVKGTVRSTKMAEVDNAFDLSSGTPMEGVYATHANKLKALGNQARKEYQTTPPTSYSASAKKAYPTEVASLDAKLNVALKNAPIERQALIVANKVVRIKRQENPGLSKDGIKKVRNQALNEARNRVGAGKTQVDITPKEWTAIQAGAISNNKLTQILNNADLDTVKQLATPRTTISLTPAKESRAKSMLSSGYTQAEIADALGISVSTVSKINN